MESKKVAVINLKGGVGKTTTAVGLATMLAGERHRRVLLVDLDPQTNATIMLIGEEKWRELNKKGQTLHTLFKSALDGTGPIDIESFIQKKRVQYP